MDVSLLLKGCLIGVSIAAPVGPIAVLCIRRTLAVGPRAGLVSGLGAASADALYGCIAGFGLTAVSQILVSQKDVLSLVGGLFLLYLGMKTLVTKPAQDAQQTKGNGLLGMYASTFILTLTNPMTILSFVAIFAGLGLGDAAGSYASAGMLVLGVFLGSALWWLMLSGVVGVLRASFSVHRLRLINLASGLIIFGFGLFAVVSLIMRWVNG